VREPSGRSGDAGATWALIAAAGSGERLGIDRPKAFAVLGGRPLLAESVDRLDRCPLIDAIVAAEKKVLDAEVAASWLTSDQETAVLATVKSLIDDHVDGGPGAQHRLDERGGLVAGALELRVGSPVDRKARHGYERAVDVQRNQPRLVPACDRGRLLVVPFRLVLIDERHEEIPPLDLVAPFAFEQTLSTTDPAASRADLASHEEVHSTPEGTADGRQRFACIEILVMSAFEGSLELVVSSEHVGGGREQLEVGGFEWRGGVRARKEVVRRPPGSARIRLAAALEIRACCHGLEANAPTRGELEPVRRAGSGGA